MHLITTCPSVRICFVCVLTNYARRSYNISYQILHAKHSVPIMLCSVAGEETESSVGGSKQPLHGIVNALMLASQIEVIRYMRL